MSQIPLFRVRAASADDADALSGLIVGAFSSYDVRIDPPSGALRETSVSVRAKVADRGGVIAETDGRMIGCILFSADAPDALYIGRLAVDLAWRRRGVARALMAHAEAEARRRGLARMSLKVRVPLVGNQALFKSCGFVEVSREAHAGYIEPTSIRMEKRL